MLGAHVFREMLPGLSFASRLDGQIEGHTPALLVRIAVFREFKDVDHLWFGCVHVFSPCMFSSKSIEQICSLYEVEKRWSL
jgi:hypothetical protein